MSTTIRDVAREAGVSIQTVSNVLNRRPGVTLATRQRVRAIVQQLDYRPSVAARTLRTGRAPVVGLLVADIANPYFAELARGAEDAARARGYSVILGNTDEQTERIRRLLNDFQEHRVTGVVAATGGIDASVHRVFETFAETIPLVQLGCAERSDCIPRVLVDDRRGAYVATAHLLSLGRRRLTIITGPLDLWSGLHRLEGFRAALADWGLGGAAGGVVEGAFTFESGYRGAESLFQNGHPDGIVAGNDLIAVGAIAFLRARGLQVPHDVAVIGYDDADIGRLYDPPISTIAQPKIALGRRGVDLLLDQIEAFDRDPEAPAPTPPTEVLDCELIVRRSSSGRSEEIRCGSIFSEAPWLRCPVVANTPLPRRR